MNLHKSLAAPVSKMLLLALLACLAASGGLARADEPLRLKCRVTDLAGNPLAGVTAKVRELAKQPSSPREALLARAAGLFRVKPHIAQLPPTTADGIVATGELKPGKSYVLEFEREGFLPADSRRSHEGAAGEVQLPDVTLLRLRTVVGKVRDVDGRGLADVEVFQSGNGAPRTSTKTSGDGSFELAGVPEGPSLVFGRQAGFWFRGALVPPDGQPLSLTLAPSSQPNVEQYDLSVKSPPDVPVPNERDTAVATVVAEVKQAALTGDRLDVQQPFIVLSMLDGVRADQLLDEIEITSELRDQLRTNLIVRMVQSESDFDVAKAILQTVTDPEWRVLAVHSALYVLGEGKRQQRQELLATALTDLRTIDDVYQRTHQLTLLYPFLVKIGEAEIAQQLVADALKELGDAGDSPQQRQVYGSLAEAIAPYEPDLALQLLDKAEPMYAAWVAWGIAPHKPEQAAELVRNYKFQSSGGSRLGHWHCLPRICYHMAPANMELAKEMADLSRGAGGGRFEPYVPAELEKAAAGTGNVAPILLKAKVYGFMARAVLADDPDQAKQLLREAVEMLLPLQAGVRNTSGGFIYTAACVLGSLVRTAAEVDPGWAAELCWQALALRLSPLVGDTQDAAVLEINHAELAQVAAALDRGLAVELLRPLSQRAAARTFDGRSKAPWIVYAFRVVDPQGGWKWLDSLCDEPAAAGQRSPRQLTKQMWLVQAAQNVALSSQPIAQQAETWVHSTLWMNGVVPDGQ